MKRIYIIIAGLAVLLNSVSCNKIDDKGINVSDVKIDVKVAELNIDTKAVKTGWTAGDIVNVYLSDAESYVPDFTLTYDGSTWTPSELTDDVKARLQSSGTIKGFWEASNTAATNGGDWKRNGSYIFFNSDNKETTGFKDYLTAYFSVPYTCADGSLVADIDSWTFPRGLIQIVVTGLAHDEFCLAQSEIAAFSNYLITNDEMYPSLYGVMKRIAGVENEDGLAFVGRVTMVIDSGYEFVVKLYDLQNGDVYTYTKTLETTLKNDINNLYAIKIPFSKFELEGTSVPDITDGGEL